MDYPNDTVSDSQANQGDNQADNQGNRQDAGSADAAKPVVQALFKRAVDGAHQAVDGAAAKVAPVVDGITKAKDTKDEWIGAAREAIVQHPFAAIATALLVGAAYNALTSSRSR